MNSTPTVIEAAGFEARLQTLVRSESGVPPRLLAAMEHSLFSGGKRLRPRLLLGAYDAFRSRRRGARRNRDAALDAACALEMIHTYSLIHDDLPAMDDDDLRRGRPSCHVAYGEATAILAGDALLTRAFGILADCGPQGAELTSLVARAAGPAGMVGGQQDDLDAEGSELTPALIRRIHRGKTARLIAAPLTAGALIAGVAPDVLPGVESAGLKLGFAFQAVDDVLDVVAERGNLGKTPGKDAAAGKATWVRLEGLDAAQSRARRYGLEGTRQLRRALPAGAAADKLLDLVRLLWDRDR